MIIKKNFKHKQPIIKSGDYKLKDDTAESTIIMDLEDYKNYNVIKNCCEKDVNANKDDIETYTNLIKQKVEVDDQVCHKKHIRIKCDGIEALEDTIHLFLIFDGNIKRDMKIRGFYYYGDEKKYGYRFVTSGHSELQKDREGFWYRSFEFTSLDIANNEETIKGKYYTSDSKKDLPWEFNIFNGTRKIAESIVFK
jgi:hypothetical protein